MTRVARQVRAPIKQIGPLARFVTCRTNGFRTPNCRFSRAWKHGLIMAINSALSI